MVETNRGALNFPDKKILTSKIDRNAIRGDQPPEPLSYVAKPMLNSKIVLDEWL
jgi:hypothetical protein